MDEEEELENTLIGQEEEAPAIDTGNALMGAGQVDLTGQVNFRDYDVPEPSRTAALSVFAPSGDLKPGIDVNAITPAPEMSTEATSVAPKSALLEMLERADERERMGLPRQAAPGIIDAPSPVVDPFTGQTIESPTPFNANNSLPAGMTMGQAAIMKALPDQNQGMDMNQQAVSNAQIQGVTQGQETTQGQEATAPSLDQTLSQFMRNEDAPEQRTEQFVDPQGRLRRRLTPEASALQGFAPGVQPLAPEYTGFEQASADLQDRLRDQQTRPGESQADRDTRVAQSRTTGGQTGGLSFDDARRRAEGQLAARGVRNPSASQVNALARSIQAAEPERLAELETQRALTQGRIDALDAQLAQSGIVPSAPPVIDPETGVITQTYTDGTTRYKGLTRVIEDTPEKTGLQATLENLQSDLDSGRLTQEEYDIASKNAKDRYIGREKPKPAKPEETSGLIDMDGEAPVATETAPQTRVTINTQAEYDALAVGTPYIDSQGTPGIKK